MTAQTVAVRVTVVDPPAEVVPVAPVPPDPMVAVVRQPIVQPLWVFASQGLVGVSGLGTWVLAGFDQWGLLLGCAAAAGTMVGCVRVERRVLGNRRYNYWSTAKRLDRDMRARAPVAVDGSHGDAQERG